MASPERHDVVLRYGENQRELTLCLDTTLLDLRILVAHLFELQLPDNGKELLWEMTYIDNEGDIIHITNDMELEEAYTMNKLEINIQKKHNVQQLLQHTLNTHVLPHIQATIFNVADWFEQQNEPSSPRIQQHRQERVYSETESESDEE
ncbi:hypothetical protein THRCLA_23373 [Thraustotheca clavata]|uniref:PB1 domain-containing protein n=1 Tax=Thraustotheca clavata TaxID=74557 RepID=A0A1V9Y6T7_9STRA|nr:hypothetical protein THRCLA_23373 [Thraustotheca clavata]